MIIQFHLEAKFSDHWSRFRAPITDERKAVAELRRLRRDSKYPHRLMKTTTEEVHVS